MKKIKSLISILLTLGIALFICNKPDVVLANNHTLCTVTNFGFIDHHARVNVDFTGYEDTTILRVDVKIERQNFLFFNETVVSASYDSQGKTYQNEFFYPIYADGVYDCTVTYTVMNGGEEDLITFFDTQTYINSNYTEHTHVWNRERTESSFQLEGLERKFCYCGKFENTVLEKLTDLPDTEYEKQQISSGAFSGVTDNFVQSSGVPTPNQTNQSASLNQPFNGFSGYQSYCNCMSCMWERSTAKIREANPQTPTHPTVKTTDPWYNQYMEPKVPTNCRRSNR
jgi:hypothetical protein